MLAKYDTATVRTGYDAVYVPVAAVDLRCIDSGHSFQDECGSRKRADKIAAGYWFGYPS